MDAIEDVQPKRMGLPEDLERQTPPLSTLGELIPESNLLDPPIKPDEDKD